MTALEQHGPQLPIGADFFTGVEEAKLIAQRTDVLVAPILFPGVSPYHMVFPGTIALSPDTVQRVYFEAAQSLAHHGIRRFLLFSSHAGNQAVSRYIIDRINQETPAVAVDLMDAAGPFWPKSSFKATKFDRHAGVGETSGGLYLFLHWWTCRKRGLTACSFQNTCETCSREVIAKDPGATSVFLAEGLKPEAT